MDYAVKDLEDMELDQIWDFFINYNICSEETLQVVTDINGYNVDTMKDILYATTGLRSLEQLVDENGLTPEDDPDLFWIDEE